MILFTTRSGNGIDECRVTEHLVLAHQRRCSVLNKHQPRVDPAVFDEEQRQPSPRTGKEAINSTLVNNSSNVLQGAAQVIAFPWLSGSDTWFLLKNNGSVRPFIFQDREAIEFSALAEGSDDAFKRERFLYGVRARYRIAYGYWQFAVQTQFVVS